MSETQKNRYPFIARLALKHSLIQQDEIEKAVQACANEKDNEQALKKYLLENRLISELNLKRIAAAAKTMEMRQKDIKFGTIAVQKGFVTQTIIELALDEQKKILAKDKKAILIGNILVEAGMISITQRDKILKVQNRLKRLNQKKLSHSPSHENKKEAQVIEQQVSNQKKPVTDNEPQDSEIFTRGIKLVIPKDTLAAYISKTEEFDENITVQEIKQILEDRYIVFGIVDNSLITGFINSSGFKAKPFRVAKGIAPEHGKDAKLHYFFDTDHLQAGQINDKGVIDFKERGKIPQIEEGFILAEKTPLKKEQPGKNILGDPVSLPSARDVKIKYGKGTRLSKNGLQIIATTNGQPKLSWSGIFSVLDEFVTRGDVDYETGHIDYQGNIKVKGCIKNGFKVCGNHIRAQEIDGGIIHAEGDLSISDGINEAVIYAKGNVWAKYIHKSKIICMGDIYCTKEIVESKIENSGACVVNKGKLIHCDIISKMGVYAKDIGSKLSTPCTIKTGTDIFVVKELARLKEQISDIKKNIVKNKEKKQELEEKNTAEQEESAKLAHIQDRSQIEQKNTITKIASLDKISQIEKIKEMKAKLQHLKQGAKNAEQQLNTRFDTIDLLSKEINQVEETILLKQELLEELFFERGTISELAKNKPGVAIIEAYGTIMEGTLVAGKHSETRIERNCKKTQIKELMFGNPDGNQKDKWWEMRIAAK